MDKQQATRFIKRLFSEVWTDLDEDKIADYYHEDLEININAQNAKYHDLVNRLRYIKSHYNSITNTIDNIVVDKNKIAVRLYQTYHTHSQPTPETYMLMFVYEIQDNKVAKISAITNPNFNYFAK